MSSLAIDPTTDPSWNHSVHAYALCRPRPGFKPSYVRQDRKARGRSAVPPHVALDADFNFYSAASSQADPTWDRAWFDRRWQLGDATVVEKSTEVLASALASPTPFPPERTLKLRLSGALEDDAWASQTDGDALLCAGIGVLPMRCRLALLAARLESVVPTQDLSDADARYLRRQTAATLWYRAIDASEVDTLLAAVAESELPTRYEGPAFIERIERLAPRLDQPPGEIVRLSKGLSRRYTDRLHRAWERGFFLPRDVDPAALIAALGAAR